MADGTLVSTTVVRDELRLPWEKCKMPRKFPGVAQIDRQAGRQAGRQADRQAARRICPSSAGTQPGPAGNLTKTNSSSARSGIEKLNDPRSNNNPPL